ncbi:MAG TPA: ribosome biogenesis GTPase Der [Gammaproteobacteria bacterium]|nr:ribosome biogenesis GTPase Der [Gammaproteobacteria bacterium]
MMPVIVLLGRPNVGKSTLFNRLTRSRDALVADVPGLTRDRHYGYGRLGSRPYIVVDTGGLGGEDELGARMARQSWKAFEEADIAIFLTDGRAGLTPADREIAMQLRRAGKPVRLAVNKAEGLDPVLVGAEFHALGLGEPHAISAAHGEGVEALIEGVLAELPPTSEEPSPEPHGGIRVAVIGRPNVGKSTLINRLLGEERLIAYDEPGTTRDSIAVPFERDGRRYTLIDTAGVRRRSRVEDPIEKFSVIKTLQAIDAAEVVIAVLDAREGVAEQDASLLGLAIDRGRALVVAVNKWDGLTPDQRDNTRRLLDLKLPFLTFARVHFISALHGTGVGDLMRSVDEAQRAAMRELATPELTRVLEQAVTVHQPPLVRGRRIKLRYAHQGGRNPPVIVIHGNQTEAVPDTYRRYLENVFREAFNLYGTPVRIEFRTGRNPYEGRRNVPSLRQIRHRQRLMNFIKRGK